MLGSILLKYSKLEAQIKMMILWFAGDKVEEPWDK